MAIALLFGWSLHLSFVKVTSFDRAALVVVILSLALLVLSADARRTAREIVGSPVAILTALTCFAVAMSFGPHIHARGRLIEETNLYGLFYDYVPGFDGLRVPARFGMIVALGLAALSAFGIVAVRRSRHGRVLSALAGAAVVVESLAIPLPLNGNDTNYKQPDLVALPPFVA